MHTLAEFKGLYSLADRLIAEMPKEQDLVGGHAQELGDGLAAQA
jgi:hypothetical protein